MKRPCLLVIPAMLLLLFSCGKSGHFPSTPDLTFKSIYPGEVHSGDSVQIVCSFRDKEGDLQDSIFYRASNNDVFGSYEIPGFPAGHNVEGDIILNLYSGLDFTPPTGGAAADTIYFDVYVRDRAGHISDTVQSTPVIVFGD